jgi:hypothetical protein
MRLALLLTLALLALTHAPPPASAQDVTATASLNRDRISAGETVVLTVLVNGHRGAAELLVPPVPSGLVVIGTSDFSQFQLSAPGRRVRMTRREIGITAQAPGVYRFEPVTVRVDGRTMRTRALELTVTGTMASPSPFAYGGGYGENAVTTALRLDVAPDTVYVGQQMTLHAEVTFAEDSRSRQSRPASFEPPAPSGFWVQDLPDPVSVSLRVREGRTVETQTYRRAYFPLSSGEFWFPPAHLHYELRRGFLQPPESRRVSSDSVRVFVRPLPQPRPAAFHGAVGRFELDASLTPRQVAMGEAAVLVVEVRGRGNVKALPQPRLPEIDGVQIYPPNQESSVDAVADEVGGRKRFRWMLVPERAGTFTIPPIEYAYFDPELRTYITLASDSLVLHARPVVAAEPRDTMLRPLRMQPEGVPFGWARTPAFAALQLLPLLLVGAGAAVRRQRRRPPGPAAHARRLRRAITALSATTGQDERLAGLERLLLEAVACVAGGSSDYDDAAASLRRLGRHAPADELTALLAEIRSLRYAPHGTRGDSVLLMKRCAAFVDALAPGGRRRGSGAATGAVVALLLGGVVFARQQDTFASALALHQAGDVVAAANVFHAYARSQPADPAGWYNLGVAAHEAGDTGRAAWAWLRTVRVAPRDADAHHNLVLIGAADAATRVAPLDRLAVGERLALAAFGWWLLVLGLGFAVLAGARPARWLAATGALVLCVTAAGATAAMAAPRHVTPLGVGASVHAGPSVHDDVLDEIPPGALARFVERRGDWLLVRLDGDRLGWMERAAVAAP